MKQVLNAASAVLLLASASVPAMAQTQYIVNGSFEQSTVSSDIEIANACCFYASPATYSTAITGWVIPNNSGENLFYYSNATAGQQGGWFSTTALTSAFDNVANVAGDTLQPGATQNDPETGGHFIALDGNDYAEGDSSISQTVTGLTAGNTYQLTFDWGGTQLDIRSGPTTEAVNVWFGDAPLSGQLQTTQTVHEGTHYFSGWMQATMDFVAQSSTQVLTFQAMGTPAGMPPMVVLDGVSLTNAATVGPVPEASTWTMLLAGCGAIGVHALRRRRAQLPNA